MNDWNEQLETYIDNRNKQSVPLNEDTDLYQTRIIDSLQFVEFIAFLEEIADISIDMESIDIENFRTLRNLKLHLSHEMDSQAA